MTSRQNLPTVPGFIVQGTTDDDGLPNGLLAIRIDPLTPYQLAYGCREEVAAATATELGCLCIAELVHAAMVARAEDEVRTSQRIAETLADSA